MKILFLIDALEIGGAETHVELLATELKSMGHEIVVASGGGKIHNRLIKNGIKCIHLPKIEAINPTSKLWTCKMPYACQLLSQKRAVACLIDRINPHIVHAHTRRTAFFAHQICKKQKIPLVVTVHAKFSMKFPKKALSKWGDTTIAVSEDIKNHLVQHGVAQENIEIIPNGVNI
jgi:glycosyltransferase involved in cell wall biosynthesis